MKFYQFPPVWYLYLSSASTCFARQRVMTYFHKFAVSFLFHNTKQLFIHPHQVHYTYCMLTNALPRCHLPGIDNDRSREPETLCGRIFCGKIWPQPRISNSIYSVERWMDRITVPLSIWLSALCSGVIRKCMAEAHSPRML